MKALKLVKLEVVSWYCCSSVGLAAVVVGVTKSGLSVVESEWLFKEVDLAKSG